MPRRVLAKTTGSTLVELMVVIAIMASLAVMAVPTFIIYRDRSRVAQVVGSGEAIRAALASYAADNAQNAYPATGTITDFNSLRLVVNAHGGASITASATPNGLFHQGRRPKRPRHKGFEKAGLDSELPKVADAVIRARMVVCWDRVQSSQWTTTIFMTVTVMVSQIPIRCA